MHPHVYSPVRQAGVHDRKLKEKRRHARHGAKAASGGIATVFHSPPELPKERICRAARADHVGRHKNRGLCSHNAITAPHHFLGMYRSTTSPFAFSILPPPRADNQGS